MLLYAGGGFPVMEPSIGLIFWTTVLFLLTWAILAKFAFKPIANALRTREESIDTALKSAERARAEVAELKNENEEILKQAREERSKIIKEANDLRAKIVEDAKSEAKSEAAKVMENARQEIATQKAVAFAEVKQEVGKIAVEIAEQLTKQNLEGDKSQQDLIASLIQESNFNQN